MRAQQVLEGVQSDLVLLHVGVHEHHRLDLVVDAVPDEVELQDKLLAKDKAKVGLAQELVQEIVILLD